MPSTNVGFLTAVQFDGRETAAPLTNGQTFAGNLVADLKHQALDATIGHAEAAKVPTDAQLMQIIEFESALNTAQIVDTHIGSLNGQDANGGAKSLSNVGFFPGINDPQGGNPTGAAFNPGAFTLYAQWMNSGDPHRRSVARGEEIFNCGSGDRVDAARPWRDSMWD